ncbi:2-hydroxyacid dehydrogenase [Halpernia frigidisoli]|uniref:Glyoxylate/hydroxypyruvate reductase B n=1 Tax=Halpernia frigidisoli TaxID=1125876 RepID=A0A1I3D801_9FLAO|nr:D-glycerate dehydrogenase [Halpernia frigidisoli]SFH82832.1 Lactate dehydrogenase [Halpernia frigidisoli]
MKIFLNKAIPQVGMKILNDSNNEIIIPAKENISDVEFLKYCKNADVILNVGGNKLDKEFFDNCPNLKAISLFSVGYNSVDIAEATKRKIPVGNTPDVLSRATSDIAFLLMQSVSRLASHNFQKVKDGNWGSFDPMENLGQELYGKTLGVFGLGRIGFEMAKKCKAAFDMEIIYHNRSRNEEVEKELGAKYVSFEELVKNSDVLSIHANFEAKDSNLFNAEIFAKMKPNLIFINTARGGFQNEKDLYKALKNGTIWGAGLDVTNPEPMEKSNSLLQLSNVCVLPHIGSATIEARNGMAKIAAENAVSFTKGEKMKTCVNPEVYI